MATENERLLNDSLTSKALRGAPSALAGLLESKPPALAGAADRLSGRRVWLLGLGTSHHAALVGEGLFLSAGAEAHSARSIDFALYPPPFGPKDAVIAVSHGGGTRYTRDAVALARKAGCFTVGITAEGGDIGAEARITTLEPERTRVHTVSFLAALVELGRLALAVAERAGGRRPAWARDWAATPERLRAILDREPELDEAAKRAAASQAVRIVGAGPNAATAAETALKLNEMAHLGAQPLELETSLHGPLCAVDRDSFVGVFAASGPSLERIRDLLGALETIGARSMLFGHPIQPGGFAIDDSDEAWSPAPLAYAGQLFALRVAAIRGKNPDVMRTDDPVYEKAFDGYRF
jgi:glucosamine--fructose-6-phosphate aminotransferase (isomerizing)